jgi:hypothetical protein
LLNFHSDILLTRTIGLHPEEAVTYLQKSLREHENRHPPRPLYAITGTGHHSRNGKDKIGKAIRTFLQEWRYTFREFSVPGDRNSMGGIIGVDPGSVDRSAGPGTGKGGEDAVAGTATPSGESSTKVRILRKEDVEAEEAAAKAAANANARDEDGES